MSNLTVVSVGAAIQDVFLSNSDEFKPVCLNPEECFMRLDLGSKEDVNNINFSTGGGATNAAVTFARSGMRSIFMGTIGRDPAGQAVLNDLDKNDVDSSHVKYSEVYNTGYSVLLLAPNGERTILTYRGASTHYQPSDFDLSNINADWLYVSNLAGNMETLDSLFRQAREKGTKVFFNPGKKELAQVDALKSLLEDVEVLLVNKEEAQMIVQGQTVEELVHHLLNFVPVVVVTDGSNGVVASDGKKEVRAGIYEDVDVKDRTGAGDAFGSGFLSQWMQGSTLEAAVTYASANSTNVVTEVGAKEGILYKGAKIHDMPLEVKVING